MSNNLFDELNRIYSSVKVASGSVVADDKTFDIPKNFQDRIDVELEGVKDIYRKDVIDKYVLENGVVRDAVNGRTSFFDVGAPILDRVEEVCREAKEVVRTKNYVFQRKDLLVGESGEAVDMLAGVLDVGGYFGRKSVLLSKDRLASEKKFYDKLNDVKGLVLFGSIPAGGLAGYLASASVDDGFGRFLGGCFGAGILPFSLIALDSYLSFRLERTPEEKILEPARKMEEDLIGLDEMVERIYFGGKE